MRANANGTMVNPYHDNREAASGWNAGWVNANIMKCEKA